MTQTAINYAKAIYELDIPYSDVAETAEIMRDNRELYNALANPTVSKSAKRSVVDKIFPVSVHGLMKLLCDNGSVEHIFDIAEYHKTLTRKGLLHARLTFADRPTETRIEQIKERLMTRYGKDEIELELKEDKSLIGGFVINCGSDEIDYSIRSRIGDLYRNLIRR